MRVQIGVILVLLVVLRLNSDAHASVVASTFDSGDEGWSVVEFYFSDGGPGYQPDDYTTVWNGPVAPQWSDAGGCPDGHVHFTEPPEFGQCFYFQAPSGFLGNQSAMLGGTLSWCIKTAPGGPNDYNADVVLMSPEHIIVNYNPDQASTEWQVRSVLLQAGAGWLVGNHEGAPATEQILGEVLANLTGMYIRGEFLSGIETGYLDSVTLTPEPAAMSLLMVGLALFARRR